MIGSHLKLPLLALALAVPGCADDDADVDDAAAGFRSVNLALAGAVSGIDQDMVGDDDLAIEGTCAGGGNVVLSGIYEGNEDFSLDVEFMGCNADGIVIDGELSYAGSVDVEASGQESSTRVEVSMTGNLMWSGQVSGPCSIDMSMKIATEASAGMASAEIEASGSICGHSAQAVIKASAG